MFEYSNIPLRKWFYAVFLFLSHRKGIIPCNHDGEILVWYQVCQGAVKDKELEDAVNGVDKSFLYDRKLGCMGMLFYLQSGDTCK